MLTARPADLSWIETVHRLDYIRRAAAACKDGAPFLDTPDVVQSQSRSFDVATLAVGAALTLADDVIAGHGANGFALVRPPGHHAEREAALGFCLFNNIAVLARYLQRQHGLDKIAILDWDVHHGNGTQHSFEEDPSVLYISLHQYPYYPGHRGRWRDRYRPWPWRDAELPNAGRGHRQRLRDRVHRIRFCRVWRCSGPRRS